LDDISHGISVSVLEHSNEIGNRKNIKELSLLAQGNANLTKNIISMLLKQGAVQTIVVEFKTKMCRK